MPGSIFSTINPSTTSGTQLATLLNDFRDIVVSGFQRSPTRPAGLLAGGYWIDTSFEASPDFYWTFKIFDGTNDIDVFRINLDTSNVSITGSENLFTLQRISDDNVGAIYRLKKARIAGGGALLSGDGVGRIEWQSKDDAANEPIVSLIRAVATENHTATGHGTALVFETVDNGSTTRVEAFRVTANGIVVGTGLAFDGITNYKGLHTDIFIDNAGSSGVRKNITVRTASGQTATNSVIEAKRYFGLDENGDAVELANLSIEADGQPSTTNSNAALTLTLADGGGFFVDTVGGGFNKTTILAKFTAEKNTYTSTSAENINSLISNKAMIEVLGTGPAEIRGLSVTDILGQTVVTIHNSKNDVVVIKHDNSGALASERIILPKAKDIKLQPNSSIELFYHSGDAKWKVKSGSGGGGAEPTVVVNNTLTASAQITLPDEALITLLVEGASAAVTLNTLPFGSTAPATNGTQVTLIGTSNTNTVALVENDAAKGVILNGSPIVLTRFKSITLQYIAELDRYVEISRS